MEQDAALARKVFQCAHSSRITWLATIAAKVRRFAPASCSLDRLDELCRDPASLSIDLDLNPLLAIIVSSHRFTENNHFSSLRKRGVADTVALLPRSHPKIDIDGCDVVRIVSLKRWDFFRIAVLYRRVRNFVTLWCGTR
ncbi:MAG: hypothetical protein M3N45_09875 [Actinomycetota bacterium]|nr:hypothetical protein [Actinomycetota bacterium]